MHANEHVKNWSHHLHDDMLNMCRHIDQHLHSSNFWVGVFIALVLLSIVTLVVMLSIKVPAESFNTQPLNYPYVPYR